MTVYKTGITPLSFTQQFLLADPTKFCVNGKLYLYEAALTTPVKGYSDANAQFEMPNPITLGADGRIPPIYFIMADDSAVPGTFVTIRTSVRMRLLDKNGVIQFDYQVVPLMTSDTGSGAGPAPTPVDPLGLMTTGMGMWRYGVGKIPGFVRANGLTIGNDGSGANELASSLLANALYLYLWDADPSLHPGNVNPGSTQFAAGIPLVLPNFSGCVLAGLDNMADVAAGVLTTATFTVVGRGPTVLGAQAGAERHIIAANEMPVHQHDAFIHDPQHAHPITPAAVKLAAASGGAGGSGFFAESGAPVPAVQNALTNVKVRPALPGVPADDNKTANAGGGAAHLNLQPSKLVTFYIRL